MQLGMKGSLPHLGTAGWSMCPPRWDPPLDFCSHLTVCGPDLLLHGGAHSDVDEELKSLPGVLSGCSVPTTSLPHSLPRCPMDALVVSKLELVGTALLVLGYG